MTDMQIVAHRINTVERLRRLPTHWGVELDLRADGSELILTKPYPQTLVPQAGAQLSHKLLIKVDELFFAHYTSLTVTQD